MFLRFSSLFISCLVSFSAFADLTVYTDRPSARFEKAAKVFTEKTGQKLVLVEGAYPALLAQIEKDAEKSPADLIVTKDLVYLTELAKKDLIKPLQNSTAVKQVRSFMRDPQNRWVALTYRTRTVAYDPARTSVSELSTYEDLADSKWMGRLCLRTSRGTYNEALLAQLIHKNGYEKAKSIVSGWLDNLAEPVMNNDVAVLEAIATGRCEVGIVNHYYLAGVIAKNPNFPVRVAFLDQAADGVHTNGTGVALLKTSAQADLAQTFVDIMLSDEIQLDMSAAHLDFPSVEGLHPDTFIKDWGTFKMDQTPWSDLGEQVESARKLIGEVDYR